MQKVSIVLDVQGKIFNTGVDKKISISEITQSYSWENDKRSEPQTKYKRLVSS